MGTGTDSVNSSALESNCHDELVRLANIQETRVLALVAQEQKSGSIILALNTLINDYIDLLLKIQEVRFDLGLDEYKRGKPITKEEADRRTQEQVFEAIHTMEEIFRQRGIPVKPGDDIDA
jgi:hypothetical protein